MRASDNEEGDVAELPSGTVTFLLTDVEGSVPLWEQDADAMQRALVRHDALVDECVTRHAGSVVHQHGEGDSRFLVFVHARDAVAAACDLQREFQREAWLTASALRVRMALHTGAAIERGGHYYGSAVNRCARLRSLGHGGQVLLSEVTAILVRDTLPVGTTLRDLAEHPLRGFAGAERVFQLVHPGLPADFPPLVGAPRPRHNLPTETTPLVGREQAVDHVCDLLRRNDVRLVTLTGAGGVGKTRVGLQVAADLIEDFADGVLYVLLAPINDPALVISNVAKVLELRATVGRPIRDTVADYLEEKHLLLLLDNFEQILPAAAHIAGLLAACPRLKVLVTSRAVLHLHGEREYVVSPLACPDPMHLPPAYELAQFGAVALFIQRAAAAKQDFSLTDENARAVAEICQRVDGLPLAIELAAARIKLLPPQALLARLGRRLPLLTGGARNLPARQRTIRDTIAWSYDLLDEAERRLLQRLAVFMGGFTVEAAEAVCTPEPESALNVLDGVASLVDKSLLQREDVRGEPRFTMFETIREYALERLESSGESSLLRGRHLDYYLALAEHGDSLLRGPEQAAWLARLEADHDNLRAALDRAQVALGGVEAGLRLAGALASFWWLHGHFDEGRRWLDQICVNTSEALDVPGTLLSARAKVLDLAGVLAHHQGDLTVASALFEQALVLATRAADHLRMAWAHQHLGLVNAYRGRYDEARSSCAESIRLHRARDDKLGVAIALVPSAITEWYAGDIQQTILFAEESAARFRAFDDQVGVAYAIRVLAAAVWRAGDAQRALRLCDECISLFRKLGNERGVAMALLAYAPIVGRQGDPPRAMALYRECITCFRDVGDRWGMTSGLEGLGILIATSADLAPGEVTHAARILAATELLRTLYDAPIPRPDYPDYVQAVTALRSHLGEPAFAAAWAEGRAMSLEQAVAYALDEQPSA
jgi:predicted ATPase/class 3 adenylate cyclase